ncbi:sensor histidine kinase [Actinoplanes utahensis]|uniref:histidine kinase n=1 Tax=Actinoplanes utahensis TaxID=1869 RepID=A0A0A6UHA7_ACTUT|nr:histidine kinase [Actinoplanes utahensis]KHD74796.1 hypothetical protein MB27_26555 [Actinoplanes utahensis]
MGNKTLAVWRDRNAWGVVLALLVLSPVVLAPPVGWVVAVPAAVATAVAFFRWPVRGVSLSTAVAATAGMSLTIDVIYPGPHGLALFWLPFEMLALVVSTGLVIRLAPHRRVFWVGGLVVVAALLLPLRFTARMDRSVLNGSILMVMLALFPVALAVGVGLYLRGQDRRRRLAVREAQRTQRLRLAGDLHDFVAHEVTGIVLEAQAGQLGPADADRVRDMFAQIEAAGLRALETMDQTVRTLRGPGGDGDEIAAPARVHRLADLGSLTERFSSGVAMTAVLDLPAELTGVLDPEREATSYAVVLEALTNVRRHAPRATEVQVRVRSLPGPEIEVSVADNGRSGGGLLRRRTGGGTGLAGLAERVRALGGRLDTGRTEQGWQVRCVFPMGPPGRS